MKLRFLLLFCFGASFVVAQKKYALPFRLTKHNNMSIQALVNDKDTVQLMFHTAASSMTLIESATKRMNSLRFDGKRDSIESWGGGGNEARVSSNNTLTIGSQRWEKVSISENVNSGPETDGKFGTNLFENKVIEINFDKNELIISDKLPRKARRYQEMNLVFDEDAMYIEGLCELKGETISNKFMLHSGYAGGLLFDDAFANDNKLGEKLTIIGEKKLQDSYGNIIKTKKAILPKFTIGKMALIDVPVGFFEGQLGRQSISILGGDVMKRFNIIIAADRKHIYLKMNNLSKIEYSKV